MKQSFAIGIPTLNRADLLSEALSHYTREFPDTKIFIIDNGDQKIEAISKNITIFKTERNIGVASSWNRLAEEIFKEHEYALILNDDIIIDAGEAIISALIEQSDADIIMCESEPGYTGFSSFILPQHTYDVTGCFDEEFYPAYFEDNDYLYRIKLEGGKVDVNSVLNSVKRVVSGTLIKDPQLDIRYNQNRNYYTKKWGGRPGNEYFTEPFQVATRRKKILWLTEYRVNSGYSRVSETLLKYLCQHYDITVVDTLRVIEGEYEVYDYPGGKELPPVKMVGKVSGTDAHGMARIKAIYQNYDIVFMIHDIWHINQWIEGMKQAGKPLPAFVAYFPIDCTGHDADWYSNFQYIDAPVTYTEFAREEVERVLQEIYQGGKYAEQIGKIRVIPHGVDSETFYTINKPKSEIRTKIFKTDRFNGDFIFLNAGRNQPRKKLELTMDAFAIMLNDHPELADHVRLYMHCGNVDQHINILKYAARLKIGANLLMSVNTTGIPQYTDDEMNELYNACDVGVNTSLGEGFCLPSAEHARTGAPQIVPNHSAPKELYGNFGLMINIDYAITMSNVMTTGLVIDVKHLAKVMYLIYRSKEVYVRQSKSVMELFSLKKFQWPVLAEKWIEVFDSIG